MNAIDHPRARETTASTAVEIALAVLGALLYAVRVTLFAVLALFEPVIRITLSVLAMGGFLACFIFKYLAHAPHFPTALMLAFSTSFAVALVLYYLLMRVLRP